MNFYSIFSVTVKFNDGNMKGIFVQARQTAGNFNTNHGYGSFESSGDSQPMKAYIYLLGQSRCKLSFSVLINWKGSN